MDNTKTDQPIQGTPQKDPLKEALAKASSIDEIHKGPAGKIPVGEIEETEGIAGNAESADDSGE
jgi:hypothetical protein